VFRDYAHWQAFRNGPVFKEIANAYAQIDHEARGHERPEAARARCAVVRHVPQGRRRERDPEGRLVGEFEKRGKIVNKVDRAPFAATVRTSLTAPDAPWPRELFDKVEAIK